MNPILEKLEVGGETLAVHLWHATNPKTTLVTLHGAGTSNKTRVEYQVPFLLEHGISVITFDFSGHGESTGKLENASLEKRVNEAKAVIDTYVDTTNFALFGSSMGGYIALKLLQDYDPKALILFAPAVYAQEAYSVPFGHGFTEIIRKPDSWRNSDIWEILPKYEGKLLTIIGDQDKVIPPGVIDLIPGEHLILPGAPHAIHQYLQSRPEENIMLQKVILKFLRILE